MNHGWKEPKLAEALADPIVRIIMAADHVDPERLAASLRQTARKVAERRALAGCQA